MSEEAAQEQTENDNPNGIAPTISFDDFVKVDLRTAKVLNAEDHPNADRLLKLTIKVGEEERTLCAGIKQWYAPEDLVGKTIVVVANLEPRKIRGVVSQGMLLAVQDGDGDVFPLTPMGEIRDGIRVS